jgi:hypothetical protein
LTGLALPVSGGLLETLLGKARISVFSHALRPILSEALEGSLGADYVEKPASEYSSQYLAV